MTKFVTYEEEKMEELIKIFCNFTDTIYKVITLSIIKGVFLMIVIPAIIFAICFAVMAICVDGRVISLKMCIIHILVPAIYVSFSLNWILFTYIVGAKSWISLLPAYLLLISMGIIRMCKLIKYFKGALKYNK